MKSGVFKRAGLFLLSPVKTSALHETIQITNTETIPTLFKVRRGPDWGISAGNVFYTWRIFASWPGIPLPGASGRSLGFFDDSIGMPYGHMLFREETFGMTVRRPTPSAGVLHRSWHAPEGSLPGLNSPKKPRCSIQDSLCHLYRAEHEIRSTDAPFCG